MPDTEILVDRFGFLFFFSFNTLTVLSHCLLASIVSDEKLVFNLTEDPLCIISCFSLVFKILSLTLDFDSLIIICPGVDLFEYTLLGIC